MMKINSPQMPDTGKRSATRGFSLVELMIVVVILGTLAAISAPSIVRSIERNNARDEARAIANTFQRARTMASSGGHPIYAKIDGTTITLSRPSGPNADEVTSCAMTTAATAEVLVYKVGTRYADAVVANNVGSTEICFSPNGRLLKKGTNQPFVATTPAGCDGRNALIWLHRKNTTATADHTKCIKTSAAEIGAQKDDRELINFFMIHVPYSGNAEVLQ